MIFWLMTIYLTTMTLAAYFGISFIFEANGTDSSISKLPTLFGSVALILTVVFINFQSHKVVTNLQKLKYQILELNIDGQDLIIAKLNDFHGFDGCGFFTIGKPLLTSIVASFTTFIIVLIQFKMAESQ